ncbi:unnamed protein product, partial [Mesorhabditis spiculigera]
MVEQFPRYAFAYEDPNFWVAEASSILPLTGLSIQTTGCIVIFLTLAEIIAGATFVMWHSFYMLDTILVMSDHTKTMHRKLLRALFAQIAVPMITVAIPWLHGAIVVVSRWDTTPQSILNATWALDAFHASISSLSILYLTEPYRRFLLQMAGRK